VSLRVPLSVWQQESGPYEHSGGHCHRNRPARLPSAPNPRSPSPSLALAQPYAGTGWGNSPGATPELSIFFPSLGKTHSWPPFPSSSVVKVQLFTTELQNHLDYSSLTIFFFFFLFLLFSSILKTFLKFRWKRVVKAGKGWKTP